MFTALLIVLVVLLIAASLMAWRYYSAAKYWRNAYYDLTGSRPSLLPSALTTLAVYAAGVFVGWKAAQNK